MSLRSALCIILALWYCFGSYFASPLGIALETFQSRVPGIWKLYINQASLQSSSKDMIHVRNHVERPKRPQQYSSPSSNEDFILLKLNSDGSFRQCSEGYQEGSWISGRWNLKDRCDYCPNANNKAYNPNDKLLLLLALDRQYYGPQHDILLEGTLSLACCDKLQRSSSSSLTLSGCVRVGKFMYPKRHPLFFDTPIVATRSNETGTSFTMEQAIASSSVRASGSTMTRTKAAVTTQDDTIQQPHRLYRTSDFCGGTFFLTIEPLPQRLTTRQQPWHRDDRTPEQLAVDIRAMPIEFYANNTFQAWGINKILRGRFGVLAPSEQQPDSTQPQLWFQVSLFGAGRSAPGSVYSEGLGLVHEDKRLYIGEITESTVQGRLFVSGIVTYGSDLGSDARPEPVGRFQLLQTSDAAFSNALDDDEESTPESKRKAFD
jgi:hypothetical protein